MNSIHIRESDCYLAFQYCQGIGPHRFSLLLKAFGSAKKAWQAGDARWLTAGFSKNIVNTVSLHKQNFDFSQILESLAKSEITYVPRNESVFPFLLKQIADCPIGLFVKGSLLSSDSKALAVVGTRKITPYGREVTEKFVASLVSFGFTIVSGLARGVDGVAHRTALEHGGRTIAVLGSGLDQIYPPEHKSLARDICTAGALVSEYPPSSLPSPGNFPARNRIVSGISLGTLVTEGASKSGSKITALMAVEQNREVFAVPGPITSLMSQGPAELIQFGAKLVMSVNDIINELPVGESTGVGQRVTSQRNQSIPTFSDGYQESIWKFLINGTQHIDEIIRVTHLPAATVTTALTLMELQGLVKSLGDGNYIVI